MNHTGDDLGDGLADGIRVTEQHALETALEPVAAGIVAFTGSGTTSMRTARKRPQVPMLSLSPTAATARRLTLLWGTHSIETQEIHTYDEMVEIAKSHALAQGLAKPGDRIVIIAGIPFATIGTTNNIRVVRI